MIFGTAGTQFLSTVSEPVVVVVRLRCQGQQYNWAYLMIFGSPGASIRQRFLSNNSLWTLKISSSHVELLFENDFWNRKD
jgi:hypothetical protein